MKGRKDRLVLLSIVFVTATLGWGCKPPTAKLKVSRMEIKPGEPVTLSWESQKAKSVDLNGEKVEKIGAHTVTPDQTTSYELVARRGKKNARDSVTVTVTAASVPAPAITLRAEPDNITSGQSATLRWSSEHAKTVTISGLGEVPATGEREVNPQTSTTYTAEAVGNGGAASASARVTVNEPPPAPTTPAPAPEPERPTVPAFAEQFAAFITPVFFAYDRAELTREEQEKLGRIADWLLQAQHRSIAFRIEGNCDPRGTAEYNLGLGDQRARAVRDFLLSQGIEATRMETLSYGLEKAQGKAEGRPNLIPSWAHDRRADFVYLRGGELP